MMSNGDISHMLSEDEQVEQALSTIQKYGAKKRGDSFDLGLSGGEESKDMIGSLLSNPQELANSLNLTEKQAENVRSVIVGAGSGGIHRLLSQHLGDEIAGALGGFVAGYIAKKVVGR